jgi:hypothetical protein
MISSSSVLLAKFSRQNYEKPGKYYTLQSNRLFSNKTKIKLKFLTPTTRLPIRRPNHTLQDEVLDVDCVFTDATRLVCTR